MYGVWRFWLPSSVHIFLLHFTNLPICHHEHGRGSEIIFIISAIWLDFHDNIKIILFYFFINICRILIFFIGHKYTSYVLKYNLYCFIRATGYNTQYHLVRNCIWYAEYIFYLPTNNSRLITYYKSLKTKQIQKPYVHYHYLKR